MTKVLHIIPYDGVGGVESAARSMGSGTQGDMEFEIDYIFKNVVPGKEGRTIFNPFPILLAARRASRSDVDVVIVSLWRSAIVGLLAKLARPKLKLVVFLHLPSAVHFGDYAFTRLTSLLATEVWADSQATLLGRVPSIRPEKCRVISFVTRRFDALPVRSVDPSFIFWGRINKQKRLDRAIRIFAGVRKLYPKAQFWVVGPDGGTLADTKDLCVSLGLQNAVIFMGAATLNEIAVYALNASFYLQTSMYEGMAMSVVESMQLGLVPVVTPVGEISSYCIHCQNAVIVDTDEKAVADILNLIIANNSYQIMRSNGISTWQDRQLYRDSVLAACEYLVQKVHEQY